MSNNPIFIISNPRSGSSIFRIVLNHADNTVFPPECGFIQWLYETYKEWDPTRIPEFISDVIKSKKMEGWFLNEEQLKNHLLNNNPQTYGDACYYVYDFYGKKLGKNVEIWGDKNNYYINHLETLSKIYPNAKYIWLTRDPRDVCKSYLNLSDIPEDTKYKPKVSSDIHEILCEIKDNQTIVRNFLKSVKKENKFKLSFEKFITRDVKTMVNLEKFTNIDINQAILNFESKKFFDEPDITIKWKEKTRENLDSTHLMTYKNHVFSDEIEKVYKLLNF